METSTAVRIASSLEDTEMSEKMTIMRLHHDNLRQSIGMVMTVLNAGMKGGNEFSPEPLYTVSDEVDRLILTRKLIELVEKL